MGFVHISGYEVVDCLFFSSFFFFRCRIVAGQKQKEPKKSIKRERFLIQFFPSLLRHNHVFLLRHVWVQFGTAVWLVRGSSSFYQG